MLLRARFSHPCHAFPRHRPPLFLFCRWHRDDARSALFKCDFDVKVFNGENIIRETEDTLKRRKRGYYKSVLVWYSGHGARVAASGSGDFLCGQGEGSESNVNVPSWRKR